MTIAALARAGGVGVETIRYYQRRGLMSTPPRGAGGGIRRYGEGDVRRLRFVRAGRAAGFTLDEVAALLALDAEQDRGRVRGLARERVAALDARIAELARARDALSALADACAGADAGPCPIIAALSHAD